MFREHLTHFSNVKCIASFTLELVYKVGRFTIGKDGAGISEAGVRASEELNRGVDWTCLAASTVAGRDPFAVVEGQGRKLGGL